MSRTSAVATSVLSDDSPERVANHPTYVLRITFGIIISAQLSSAQRLHWFFVWSKEVEMLVTPCPTKIHRPEIFKVPNRK